MYLNSKIFNINQLNMKSQNEKESDEQREREKEELGGKKNEQLRDITKYTE